MSDSVSPSSQALFLKLSRGISESNLEVDSTKKRALNSTLSRDASGSKPSDVFHLLSKHS
jgi:hypothetical protein